MSFFANSLFTRIPDPSYTFFDVDNPIVTETTFNVDFNPQYPSMSIYLSGGGGGGGYGSDDGYNKGGGGGGSGQQVGYLEVFNGNSVYYWLDRGSYFGSLGNGTYRLVYNREDPVTVSLLGASSITLRIGKGGNRDTDGGNTILTVTYLNGTSTTYTARGGERGVNATDDTNGNGGKGYWGGGGGNNQSVRNGDGGWGFWRSGISRGGGDGGNATGGWSIRSGGGAGPHTDVTYGNKYSPNTSGSQEVANVQYNTTGGGGGGGNLFYTDPSRINVKYGPVEGGYGSSGSDPTHHDANNGSDWSGQGGGGGAYRGGDAWPGNGGCGFAVLYFHQ